MYKNISKKEKSICISIYIYIYLFCPVCAHFPGASCSQKIHQEVGLLIVSVQAHLPTPRQET